MANPGADRRRGSRPSTSAGGGRPGDPVVRVLLVATALFAALGALTVVLADGAMLRLGVVAGLWAALLAVVALARRSGTGGTDPERELESMRRTYELELGAEIDARREHELTVEQTVRREIAAEAGQEIAGLRAEIERLRSHLENAETRAAPLPPQLQVVAGDGPHARPAPPAVANPPRLPRQHINEVSHPSAPGRGTGGRTVAELLAAHAQDRRRPPR